jgi:hypothetical protein
MSRCRTNKRRAKDKGSTADHHVTAPRHFRLPSMPVESGSNRLSTSLLAAFYASSRIAK